MADPIVFGDVLVPLVAELRARLVGVQVGTEVDPTRVIDAGPLVVLRRVGGARRNLVIEDATLTVEGYAPTPAGAHDVCQLAVAHLTALAGTAVGGMNVYAVDDVARPAFLADPATDQPRYTATVSVTVRGTTTPTTP